MVWHNRTEAAMARKDRVISRLVKLALLLLVCTIPCAEARAMRRLRSRSNPLLDALFKLNFIRTVEPARLPPPTGDAASLAAADAGNSPFCVNPPDAPTTTTTPPVTPTPSTPSVQDQPPPLPLPPITPVPPSFEPSPPDSGSTPTPGGQGGTPGSTTPNPPDSGGTPGGQGGMPGSTTPNPPDSGGTPGGQGGTPGSTTTPNPPQVGTSPPAGTVPPSPIVVVPSPPNSGPGSGSGGGGGSGGPFQPPIVYPPPLAPPMLPGAGQPLWCVAKPTVPDPIIQEAMDYACGTGAECGAIEPSGACYQPNTVLAHASFAFNSYWQQTRAAGGTCDFGGTATIVTRDPSYEKCKFDLL